MSKLLTNLWAGMGTLLVELPGPLSRSELRTRRRSSIVQLRALRRDVRRVAGDMRQTVGKTAENG
jgi:hypothetical protein